jgi:uncharacterized membrane protein
VNRTIENAQRMVTRHAESRMSGMTITNESNSLNVSGDKQVISRDSVATAHSQAAATAALAMGPPENQAGQ